MVVLGGAPLNGGESESCNLVVQNGKVPGEVDLESSRYRIQPIGARLPRIAPPVQVRIGAPMDLSPWRGRPVDSRLLRDVTAALMAEIQALTGQAYVSRYANRRHREPVAD